MTKIGITNEFMTLSRDFMSSLVLLIWNLDKFRTKIITIEQWRIQGFGQIFGSLYIWLGSKTKNYNNLSNFFLNGKGPEAIVPPPIGKTVTTIANNKPWSVEVVLYAFSTFWQSVRQVCKMWLTERRDGSPVLSAMVIWNRIEFLRVKGNK